MPYLPVRAGAGARPLWGVWGVVSVNRWRCDAHEEGPVFMSAPFRPVCWCCRQPMEPHVGIIPITDAPFSNPMLAHVHALGGNDA